MPGQALCSICPWEVFNLPLGNLDSEKHVSAWSMHYLGMSVATPCCMRSCGVTHAPPPPPPGMHACRVRLEVLVDGYTDSMAGRRRNFP